MQIVAADIGGTNARFALAEIDAGRVVGLGDPVILKTADHASLAAAWAAFAARVGLPLPRFAALAVAAPIDGELLQMTNCPWVIDRTGIAASLGLDRHIVINDFAAVAHAVAQAKPGALAHVAGPDRPLPDSGVVSIIGPGTGLGVAQLRRHGTVTQITATEAGHIGFAPLDAVEDAIVAVLRRRYGRVSAERIVSGPGLANIHAALAEIDEAAVLPRSDAELWAAGIAGTDALATAAVDRFCRSFGSFAGDIALAHGAAAVVLAGGIVPRIAAKLRASEFAARFVDKGRYAARMAAMPVHRIMHPEAGLLGAAAAFAAPPPLQGSG